MADAHAATGGRPVASYYCDYAWLGGETATAEVGLYVQGGTIAAVTVGEGRPRGSARLAGLTLPGLANAHSHAFHRALRARSERGEGSFWTWRDTMYSVAGVVTPENYFALARAVYAEMAVAGVTAVGEFHYLHHPPGGGRYQDSNAMGRALLAAAQEAGVRVVLLDACYLESGPGRAPQGAQQRFSDGGTDAWAERVGRLADEHGAVVGAAVHSLRAVPPAAARRVGEWAAERSLPLHVHCCEQRAENEEILAAYGATPVQLLADAGVLGRRTVAVHATHVDQAGARTLGGSGTGVCMCPTTERDLGDGIGPARHLLELGSPLSLGSDSQVVVDPLEEMRALELDERLARQRRGNFTTQQLLVAATSAGYDAIGQAGGGRLAAGAPADFVTVSLESPRLAGVAPEFLLEGVVFAGLGGDVTDVVVAGRPVVTARCHIAVGDVAGALRQALAGIPLP